MLFHVGFGFIGGLWSSDFALPIIDPYTYIYIIQEKEVKMCRDKFRLPDFALWRGVLRKKTAWGGGV